MLVTPLVWTLLEARKFQKLVEHDNPKSPSVNFIVLNVKTTNLKCRNDLRISRASHGYDFAVFRACARTLPNWQHDSYFNPLSAAPSFNVAHTQFPGS